jgi:hypothetical protein
MLEIRNLGGIFIFNIPKSKKLFTFGAKLHTIEWRTTIWLTVRQGNLSAKFLGHPEKKKAPDALVMR